MRKELSIAVLMTCYNRKDKTISCLQSIDKQYLSSVIRLDVFLVDDGSTDGTSDTVSNIFPDVLLISGDGSLYWNGGMRLAFQVAIDKGYDYYLWLNDDTTLVADALIRLIAIAEKNHSCLVVGSVQDPITKVHTYGGVRQFSKIRPLKFVAIEPDEREVLECDTFNGNCVLIPENIMLQVGNLSAAYTHSMGDLDYGLRVKKEGLKNIVAPGFYGECPGNAQAVCFDKQNNILQRLKALHSPKGVPPIEWMVFARRHARYVWPLYLLKLYIRVIFP